MREFAWKEYILVFIVVITAIGVTACGEPSADITSSKPAADTTSGTHYKLTHTAADAEYILSWDSIVSLCPDIGKYEKQKNFIRRGETKPSGSGGESSMEADSPAAWGSMRTAMTDVKGDSFRDFGVFITYCDQDEYLDELVQMQMSGLPIQEEVDFMTAVLESGPPTRSAQIHLVGKQFYVILLATASSDETLFFSKDELLEILSGVKSRISSLEITTLPPDIPERIPAGAAHEWQEFMTFRSDELPAPVRVSEGQHYNDLIYTEPPLIQVFNFTMDKDWQFVMTAEGEPDTRFEVYISITSPGAGGLSYSTDQVFSLHSSPLTITREVPLEERYTPPVDIEIKVFFDRPMGWVMEIEK